MSVSFAADLDRLAELLVGEANAGGSCVLVPQGETWVHPTEGYIVGHEAGRILSGHLVVHDFPEAVAAVAKWLAICEDPEVLCGWQNIGGGYSFGTGVAYASFEGALAYAKTNNLPAIYDVEADIDHLVTADV